MRRAPTMFLLAILGAGGYLLVSDGAAPDASFTRPTAEPRETAVQAAPRPLLVGNAAGAAAEACEDAEETRPEHSSQTAILRLLYETRIGSVAWESAPLLQVLRDLNRMTQVTFTLTPYAREATREEPLVDFAGGNVTYATLLDCEITEPYSLAWFLDGDQVRIGVRGEGQDVLARELADMSLHGTTIERSWGESLLRVEQEALRWKVQHSMGWQQLLERLDPIVPSAGNEAQPKVRVDYRLFAADMDFVRDIGFGIVEPGSSKAYLDDTQVEVIERVVTKSDRVRSIDAGEILFWAGEERTAALPGPGALTLRPTPTADGRYVALDVRLRFLRDGVLIFAPRDSFQLPSAGTVLVHAADVAPRGASSPDFLLLMLTAEVVPP